MHASAVHVLHDQEVQVLVLIDVVSTDDVRMIERCSRPGFAIEALKRGRILCFGGGQHLHCYSAAHEFMFAEINAAHAARAEAFQDLVLANGEATPFAQEKLFCLEVRENAVPN